MPLFDVFKTRFADPERNKAFFAPRSGESGVVLATQRENVAERCRAIVMRIAAECRSQNRKFRDIEFDLETDQTACLNDPNRAPNLQYPQLPSNIPPGTPVALPQPKYTPADVCRVTQIFSEPRFFVDGADSNDIIQGDLDDCWFLSAVATTSTAEGLVEKFCVARDEEIGIYGFVFFKNGRWVHVLIDDLLYTDIPKYEELNNGAKTLFHLDRDHFNTWARRGSQTLYFAKSGTDGETWVALLEKAYAKLHGDYASLAAGYAGEGVEDLTGGVSSFIQTKDILNINKFWEEELLNANKDRLFGCSFTGAFDGSGNSAVRRGDGLFAQHAYSVLRAKEVNGKKFVVVRNPWGRCEWTGRWADGSKEWTPGWLEILPELGHVFGDDGEFIMEYSDFLETWDRIDRTRLLDSGWITSSQWLRVTSRPLTSAWSFGDVCFTISLLRPSFTIIVLSQLDTRCFEALSGSVDRQWSFDFTLFERRRKEPLATSLPAEVDSRSVNLELMLEAGEYIVHVRLDCSHQVNQRARKQSRLRAAKAHSESIASNFVASENANNLALPLEAFAGFDFREMKKQADEILKARKQKSVKKPDTHSAQTVTTTTTVEATLTTTVSATSVDVKDSGPETTAVREKISEPSEPPYSEEIGAVLSVTGLNQTTAESATAAMEQETQTLDYNNRAAGTESTTAQVEDPSTKAQGIAPKEELETPLGIATTTESITAPTDPDPSKSPELVPVEAPKSPAPGLFGPASPWPRAWGSPVLPGPLQLPGPVHPEDVVYVGLRVYTEEVAGAAIIEGQLRHELEMEFATSSSKSKDA